MGSIPDKDVLKLYEQVDEVRKLVKEQSKVQKELRDLNREFVKYKKDFIRANSEIKAFQRKAKPAIDFIEKNKNRIKPAIDFFTKQRKNIEGIIKKIPQIEKAAKVGQDLKKFFDKTLFKQVAPDKAGQLLNGLSQIATAGFIAFGAKTAEEVQMYDLQNQQMVQNDLNRQLNLTLKQANKIERLQRETDANTQAVNVLAGTVGEVRTFTYRELTSLQIKFDSEQGKIPLLQQQIINFSNKFQSYDNFLSGRIESLGSELKVISNKSTPPPPPPPLNQNFASKTEVNQLRNRVTKVEDNLNSISLVPLTNKVNQIFNGTASTINRLNQLQKEIPSLIQQESTKLFNEEIKKINIAVEKKLDRDKFPDELLKQGALIIGIAKPVIDSTIKPYIDATVTINNSVTALAKDVSNNTRINDKQSQDITKSFLDIDKIKERLGEQEKVNEKGNRQLEDLLKLTLLVPPLIAKVPDQTTAKIKPLIPTPVDIARNIPSTCRFTEEGIKRHVTSDGTNSRVRMEGYHVAELVIAKNTNDFVKLADKKLGVQLAGGLSAGVSRIFQNAVVDRAISYLTYITTLHNAFQLSNSLTQTLFSAADTILQALGIKMVGVNGEELNAGGVVNSFFFNFFASIFGQDNANGMRKSWLQYSRIYQAASNMYSGIQSMFDSARSIGEMTVANVGKIGNALKKAGTVYENAYNWMSEKATAASARQQAFEKFRQGIEQAENITSSIENVASNVVGIQSELTEFSNNKNQFDAAIKGETEEKTNEEAAQKPNLTITFDNANLGRSDTDV